MPNGSQGLSDCKNNENSLVRGWFPTRPILLDTLHIHFITARVYDAAPVG